jgi:phosphate acetyltransferase
VDLVSRLRQTVAGSERRVVLPEGDDLRVLQAASGLRDERLAQPVLLGTPETMQRTAAAAGIGLDDLTLIDPRASKDFDRYVNAYASRRELSAKVAARMMRRPLFFGGMMVAEGDADAMVAGVVNPTAIVIQAGALTVGYAEAIETPSSFFLMILPARQDAATGVLMFADCAVNIAPNPAQLADIAVASGFSAARLLSDQPRVAMLSFSTDGSAAHEAVDKVTEALKLARAKAPTLAIDGEFQADTALVSAIAERKLNRPSSVAGQANVLVFPDLNAANIAYKLTQYLAGAQAIGPFLQGFAKPISDLSRGASADDIVATTVVCLAQCAA